MTYDEFQRQLGKANVNIREFADVLKMHRNSVTNYKKYGEVPAHLAVIAALMGEMAEQKLNFREVIAKIQFSPKKSRGSIAAEFGRNKVNKESVGNGGEK